jgi:hypothetical protein
MYVHSTDKCKAQKQQVIVMQGDMEGKRAMKRSACIDTLYGEIPFLDRFQAAKDDGFDAVEFWAGPRRI